MSVRPMVIGGWHLAGSGKQIKWEIFLTAEAQLEALRASLLVDVVYQVHGNGGLK